MNRRLLLMSLWVAVAVASIAMVSCKPLLDASSAFAGTTNIVFQRGFDRPDKTLRITDTNEVRRLLSAIRLQRKEACKCGHEYEAIFQKPAGEVRVSFCDHCFDVLNASNPRSYEGARLYKMPKEFYEEFRQLTQTRAADKWEVPSPTVP